MRKQGERHEPCPVAGIGASAGWIEALQRFFRAVPHQSGIAYVVDDIVTRRCGELAM